MDFNLRNAEPADYREVEQLFREIQAIHAGAMPDVFKMPAGAFRPLSNFKALLDNPDARVIVADVAGQVAGLIDLRYKQMPDIPIWVPQAFIDIDTIVVGEAFRRQGIGRALMQAAKAWADEKGVEFIRLSVWAFNEEAVAFYHALGYEVELVRMAYRRQS